MRDYEKKFFYLVIAGYLVYAGLFIYHTSFIIDQVRYFSLFDDGMISMRYAKNLAEGQGLVWNPGMRIEGYTNFLWVIFMALVHLLPLAQAKLSLVIQLSCALMLTANLFYVRRLALKITDNNFGAASGAVLLTAFYLPLNNWGLQGMEVGLLTLMLSLSLNLALDSLEQKSFSWSLYLILGLATLVRPDMVVPFLALILFLGVASRENRVYHLGFGLGILLCFSLGQTAFRWWYFGEVLPNTYYVKLTGFPPLLRMLRGFLVFGRFVWHTFTLPFLLPFVMLTREREYERRKLLLLWVFLGQAAYSIYVGGDAWEKWGGSNRYVSIAMPAFFVVFSWALSRLVELLQQNKSRLTPPHIPVYGILLGLSLICFNSIHGLSAWQQVLLLKPALHVEQNKKMVALGLKIKELTTRDAKVAVVWAGAIPYFSERPAIDLLGKSDRKIAHEKMRIIPSVSRYKATAFYPGHLKFNYDYSIGELKPDVIAQLWYFSEEAQPYLDEDYQDIVLDEGLGVIFLRKNSPHISNRDKI